MEHADRANEYGTQLGTTSAQGHVGRRRRGITIAVTSGKDGAGKTQIAANLALGLAELGLRVALFDADPGPVGLDRERQRRLLAAVDGAARDHDVVIVDMPAGIGSRAMALASQADEILVVATGEPSSIRAAYAVTKMLHRQKGVQRVGLVANLVASEAEAFRVHRQLADVVERFLAVDLDYVGYVPRDETVGRAVRAGTPFFMTSAEGPAGQAIQRISRAVVSELVGRRLPC